MLGGELVYHRGPDGSLSWRVPASCPRGHELAGGRLTLHWSAVEHVHLVQCRACAEETGRVEMFLPATPAVIARFRNLVEAGELRRAIAYLDQVLPPGTRTGT